MIDETAQILSDVNLNASPISDDLVVIDGPFGGGYGMSLEGDVDLIVLARLHRDIFQVSDLELRLARLVLDCDHVSWTRRVSETGGVLGANSELAFFVLAHFFNHHTVLLGRHLENFLPLTVRVLLFDDVASYLAATVVQRFLPRQCDRVFSDGDHFGLVGRRGQRNWRFGFGQLGWLRWRAFARIINRFNSEFVRATLDDVCAVVLG